MAIRLIDQYPNRAGVPNADYPHGVPRNKSTPTSTDGTPFEQAWFRDQEGFFQGLLETAGITPSGSPDTVEQSDYLDALVSAMHGVTEVDVGGVGDVTLGIYPSRVAALRLTGALGADVDLIVPDTERLYWIIDETTGGFSVTVRTASGTGVAISGGFSVVRSDGDDIVLSELGAGNISYDNTASGLTAETSQAAIDEVVEKTLDVFADQSLTPSGYKTIPSGDPLVPDTIIQWGSVQMNNSSTSDVALPITFPNNFLRSYASRSSSASESTAADLACGSTSIDNSTIRVVRPDNAATGTIRTFTWWAIGN